MQQTFKKSERLCSKKIIGQLFEKGSASTQTFYLFPFRVLYIRQTAQHLTGDSLQSDPTSDPVAITPPLPAIIITVSKRNFKRAVDRNLIRRRIREAYRLNKQLLFGSETQSKQPPAYIAFLYTAKAKISFEEIEKGMKLALKKL